MQQRSIYFKYNETWGEFGSKEHFFHYFWGYILPSISFLASQNKTPKKITHVEYEDCGPHMNKVVIDLVGRLGYTVEIKGDPDPDTEIVLLDRWDMLINYESVMIEDEFSLKGSISVWRNNPSILEIVERKNFSRGFQLKILEVRSFVFSRILEEHKSAQKFEMNNGSKMQNQNVNIDAKPLRLLKKFIKTMLLIFGPRLRERIIGKLLNLLEDTRERSAKRRRKRRAKVFVLMRQAEPEYYSERGDAVAKQYGASRRRFINIKKGLKILRQSGRIKAYSAGESSIIDQIKEYSQIDVAIGVKGAEFSNVIWMKPGSKIIQIIPGRMKTPPVYERIARLIHVESVSVRSHERQNPDLGKMANVIEYLIH